MKYTQFKYIHFMPSFKTIQRNKFEYPLKQSTEQTHGYSLGGNASISMTSQSDP